MNIRFHKDLYPEGAIRKAIAAYRGFAVCTLRKQGAYVQVSMRNISKEPDAVLRNEFCNYALALVKA